MVASNGLGWADAASAACAGWMAICTSASSTTTDPRQKLEKKSFVENDLGI
jgi:hypothetical protein